MKIAVDKDGSKYGQNTEADFRCLSNYEKYQKLSKIPKFEGLGSKIKHATPIWILNSKWPSFAQFWSYRKILKISKDKQIFRLGRFLQFFALGQSVFEL